MEQGQEQERVEPIVAQSRPEDDPQAQQITKKAEGYKTMLMTLLHSKETREDVLDILRGSNDPYITVPQAAMAVNDMGVVNMERGGVKVEPAVQLASSQYLLEDLVQLGQAIGQFQEADMEALSEDTYQIYVERGVKDGSIDPIQLQLEAEQLMTDNQLAAGTAMGAGQVPGRPSQQAMTEQYASKRVGAERQRATEKAAMQKKKQMNQQMAQTALQGGQ